MKYDRGSHLSPERITLSLVDENDLDRHERDHLVHCAECSEARRHLAGRLENLSNQAARFTPVTPFKVKLPASEASYGTPWTLRFYGGLVAAAICLVLVVTLSWPHLFTHNPRPYGNVNLTAESAADEKLMNEVKNLSNNSLPESLQGIVPDPGYRDDEDEFQGFVVPGDA
ncbi:MAG TPA: hypothetical protein VMU10_02705 [Desulfomonilia bacterium]|nr:hypothetical protein [Desulfomonilia bacterium]